MGCLFSKLSQIGLILTDYKFNTEKITMKCFTFTDFRSYCPLFFQNGIDTSDIFLRPYVLLIVHYLLIRHYNPCSKESRQIQTTLTLIGVFIAQTY